MKGTKGEKWRLTRKYTYQNLKEAQGGQDLTNRIWGNIHSLKYATWKILSF